MQITITWTMLIFSAIAFLLARYIYFSFLKWYEGSPYPWNPFVRLSESDSEWRIGYERGFREAKAIHKQKKLKKKYESYEQLHKNYIRDNPET